MTPSEWNAVLAPGIPWQDAYAAVEREARAFLVISGGQHTTTGLVDALYPPAEMRGDAGIGARHRLFKALAALTSHGLQDCCTRGEARKSRRGLRLVRPWLWHSPRVQLQPKEFAPGDEYQKGDRFLLYGHLCEIIAV